MPPRKSNPRRDRRLKRQGAGAGGLFVVGTERHESRRIDNQLRGRSGRQGDPGRSKFFLSLQDDLMRIFGSERMDSMLQKLGLKEDEAIIHPWINKALEKAQKKVEARNFDIRKNLLKYDDVMNDQRKVMFEQRIELMDGEDVSETVADMRHEVVDELVTKHIPESAYAEQWDVAGPEAGRARTAQPRPAGRGMGGRGRHRRRRHARAPHRGRGQACRRKGGALRSGNHHLRREIGGAADARPSVARASRQPRPSALGDRLPRLCAARSAERIQVARASSCSRAC